MTNGTGSALPATLWRPPARGKHHVAPDQQTTVCGLPVPGFWETQGDRRWADEDLCGSCRRLLALAEAPPKPCTIDGCERPLTARGLCGTHYRRLERRGTPADPGPRARVWDPICTIGRCERPEHVGGICLPHLREADTSHPSEDPSRFWAKVSRGDDETCWPWLGRVHRYGYGHYDFGYHAYKAHRVAYELAVGPIPDGLTLDHVCHSVSTDCAGGNSCLHRRCVNPAHLEPVTQAENNARKPVVPATHCRKGHEYAPDSPNRCGVCKRALDALTVRRRRDARAAARARAGTG